MSAAVAATTDPATSVETTKDTTPVHDAKTNDNQPPAATLAGTSTNHKKVTTPSNIARSKWNAALVYIEIPNEALAATARTYASRLHQLRLQRDHYRSTGERLTQPGAPIPSSCVIRFELGASRSLRDEPDYLALKQHVETTLQQCQTELVSSIVQLQRLEVCVKEQEIVKTFCEGLSKIAVALVNHHRDYNPTANIASTMQSQRLADRLVELLMETSPHVLEFGHFVDSPLPLQQYYSHIGRAVPTHSRQQNRNDKSSPYNQHHTSFLQGILEEYTKIIEACFHTSWTAYLQARAQNHHEKWQAATKEKESTIPEAPNMQPSATAPVSAPPPPPPAPPPEVPSEEALRQMVHTAVAEETRALKDTICQLQEQLLCHQSANDNDNEAATGRAHEVSQETRETSATKTSSSSETLQLERQRQGPATGKKGRTRRNRNGKKNGAGMSKQEPKHTATGQGGNDNKDNGATKNEA